jgi:hypothetical protein
MRWILKKKISVALVLFMLLSMGGSSFRPLPILASDPPSAKIFSIQRWYPCGTDYDGKKLNNHLLFPWQKTAESVWGRNVPMTTTSTGRETIPLFYSTFYLQLIPDGFKTKASQLYYAVLDDSGSIWMDPDGRFQNPLYDAKRDPANPLFTGGNCIEANVLEGRIRYSIDPGPENNTQGPYSLLTLQNGGTMTVQLQGRRFLLGTIDRPDFLENTSPIELDWDIELPLIPFLATEKHTENVSGNGKYDSFEWIYRLSSNHTTVQVGDFRLSPVLIQGSQSVYEPNTFVLPGDLDIGYPLISFLASEKHYDFLPLNNQYNVFRKYGFDFFPEFIYNDADGNSKVGTGDLRLTSVNGCLYPYTGQIKNFGITGQDGLILAEIAETNDSVNYALETNYLSQDPSMNLSAKLSSQTSDLPLGLLSLRHGTLVDNDSHMSVNFFQHVNPQWTGYLGFEWFLDNGINNKMFLQTEGKLKANNLSDDFFVDGQSEEILGQYSRSGDLDYRKTLQAIPANIRYYNATGSGFGAGVPFYRDRDNSNDVSTGDERLSHVECTGGGTGVTYPAGSIVTAGDQDSTFILSAIPSTYKTWDQNPNSTELTQNGLYDLGEPIYKKRTLSFYPGVVEAGDFRITPAIFPNGNYSMGTYVAPCVFYYHQSKIGGLTQGMSGDIRNLDVPILPGCSGIKILGSPLFRVEHTTTFDIQVNPIKTGERIWLYIDAPMKRSDLTRDPLIKKEIKGPLSGLITVTITPYTGSYSEKGAEFPLSIIAFLDNGGNGMKMKTYRDLVMESNFYETVFDNRPAKYESLLPYDFYQDTVDITEAFVLPEDANIRPSKKCVSQFDGRFPNMWASLQDADNPNDINDPYAMIASNANSQLTANYNAHGAGIDYLVTCYGYLNNKPSSLQYFIVQVNTNQSYTIWLWNDIAPKGVLNWGDKLSYQPITLNEYPSLRNDDCSERFDLDTKDPLGYNWITRNDSLGIFDGAEHPLVFDNVTLTLRNGFVANYGVNVLLSSYGSLSEADPGGDFPMALRPTFDSEDITLRVYTTNVQYDYNNVQNHPPSFFESRKGSLQYLGFISLKSPHIEDVNFTNLSIVDHGLQYSDTNYTAGEDALSPLTTPVITAPYNPLVMDYERDFIAYPSGQAHVVRTAFRIGNNRRFRRGSSFGYNSYPSITAESDPLTYFRKLGTEDSPLTDYSFYFTLQTKSGEYVRFDRDAPAWLRIDKIIVEGPMKTPKIIHPIDGSVIPETGYPLTYEYSGKLVIDREIAEWYQSRGEDWTGRIGFGRNEIFFEETDNNPFLARNQVLNYTGLPYVIKIPEIIPTQGGRLHIKVYLGDGTMTELGDCCASKPEPGIRVHGLTVDNVPDTLELNVDQSIKPVLRENESFQDTTLCNNAFVYIWQDRGIRLDIAALMDPIEMGAGDGRMNTNNNSFFDLNLDGKISFGDFETEVIGTYDLASNTWAGGVYDGRTFNVDNGVYPMELTEATNTRITQYGSDFGSRIGRNYSFEIDHLISTDEECPVYLTAYKFYDDNNDRAFTPKYRNRSHEVYMAGEKRILMRPQEDLVIDTYPNPLTAGCIPEIIDPSTPLTFTVADSTGKPLDFKFGVMDPGGRSDVDGGDIHQHLFVDTPPEPLPQYYWTRTDLHNWDLNYDCNRRMYSKPNQEFTPIQVDFSKSYEGKYKFLNFCANDEGMFEVKVYSPDHLHSGSTWVRVAPPKVEYRISPMMVENNMLRGVMSISDPDFIMTGGANRIYIMEIKAYNAQGQLIRGIDKKNPFRNPEDRDSVFHSGRLTPYTSKPGSFDLPLTFKETPSPYYLHLAHMTDPERLQLRSSLIFPLASFGKESPVFYNTTNVQYDSGLFSKSGTIEPNPTVILRNGWGYGAIYSSPREGVYMFADRDGDKVLTKADSLDVRPDGTVNIVLFAEDVCRFGVLVSANYFTDSVIFGDVVGRPPVFADDPLTIRGRYRTSWDSVLGYTLSDEMFALDWDAFPELDLKISPPRVSVFESSSLLPFRRDLLSPANYDLVYGIQNYITVILQPADSRDLPITDGMVRLQGNQAESYIYGDIFRDGKKMSASFHFTPTGVGEGIASLLYTSNNIFYDRKNPLFEGPGQYAVDLRTSFDSLRAIRLSFPMGSQLIAGYENDLVVRITEKGTGAPIQNASVSVSFSSFSQVLQTDSEGQVAFRIKPGAKDTVRVYAFKDLYLEEEILLKASQP